MLPRHIKKLDELAASMESIYEAIADLRAEGTTCGFTQEHLDIESLASCAYKRFCFSGRPRLTTKLEDLFKKATKTRLADFDWSLRALFLGLFKQAICGAPVFLPVADLSTHDRIRTIGLVDRIELQISQLPVLDWAQSQKISHMG